MTEKGSAISAEPLRMKWILVAVGVMVEGASHGAGQAAVPQQGRRAAVGHHPPAGDGQEQIVNLTAVKIGFHTHPQTNP